MAAKLLPASFRGVPFAVQDDSIGGGRRFAEHEYPGKDGVNLEDLGRRGRAYRIKGFIVSNSAVYGGGPIAVQRQLLLAALEQQGTGILVHPSLGILTVGCTEFTIGNDLAAASMASVEFTCREDTLQAILGVSVSTLAAVLTAATVVDGAATAAFEASGASGLSAAAASGAWSAQVAAGGQDATALTNLASQLPGPYGRYFAGANAGFLGSSAYASDTTVSELVAAAATARGIIVAASAQVAGDYAALSGTTSATAAGDVQALVAALLAACADPADALRILSVIAASPPTGVTGVDDLYRRAAVVAAARAATTYQPSSQEDAAAIQCLVAGLISNEIDVAGDEGEDDVYQAFASLKVAVVADLQARGAAVAPLATFNFAEALPSLALAERLYGDGTRADALVSEVDPVHPLFMPLSFQALSA